MGEPKKFPEDADTAEMWMPPKEKRTRIPFWKALGTEQELKDGKKVWVIFADVIARIVVSGEWTVSRRGPRMLQGLSSSAEPGAEILVWCADGVVCLQRVSEDSVLSFDDDHMVFGERVEPQGGTDRTRSYNDIVRVSR
ncbi:hypothetical protein EPO33_02460 [Patescibacteria group bacterium]|nr:MAG: hypothetical protein EPO33_02460 [Patescibacteria group bacterium]